MFFGFRLFGPRFHKRQVLDAHPNKKRKKKNSWKTIFGCFGSFCCGGGGFFSVFFFGFLSKGHVRWSEASLIIQWLNFQHFGFLSSFSLLSCCFFFCVFAASLLLFLFWCAFWRVKGSRVVVRGLTPAHPFFPFSFLVSLCFLPWMFPSPCLLYVSAASFLFWVVFAFWFQGVLRVVFFLGGGGVVVVMSCFEPKHFIPFFFLLAPPTMLPFLSHCLPQDLFFLPCFLFLLSFWFAFSLYWFCVILALRHLHSESSSF